MRPLILRNTSSRCHWSPGRERFSSQVVSINLAELEAPFSDRLIAENDTAHRQHLFNIAEAEREAEVQPHGMTDDLGREAMTMVRRDGGAHQSSMPHENLRLHVPAVNLTIPSGKIHHIRPDEGC